MSPITQTEAPSSASALRLCVKRDRWGTPHVPNYAEGGCDRGEQPVGFDVDNREVIHTTPSSLYLHSTSHSVEV